MSTYHAKKTQSVSRKKQSIFKPNIQHFHNRSHSTRALTKLSRENSNSSFRAYPEEKFKDVNILVKTNDHSLSLQELKNLYQVKEEHDDHFNEYFTPKRQQYQGQKVGLRRRNQSKRSQNLKNIARYLKLLLANNKNLTVKEIGHLLYQIIGQTKLGLKMIEQNCLNISSQIKKQLAQKYFEQDRTGLATKHLVRNVRRRLYDALNVMISSNIVKKSDKTLQIINKEKYQTAQKKQPLQQREKVYIKTNDGKNLQKILEEAEERIRRKKLILQETKRKYSMLKQLIQANKRSQSTQKLPFFLFPMAIVKTQPHMLIQFQKQSLSITSPRQIQIVSDMEVLQLKFKGSAAINDQIGMGVQENC